MHVYKLVICMIRRLTIYIRIRVGNLLGLYKKILFSLIGTVVLKMAEVRQKVKGVARRKVRWFLKSHDHGHIYMQCTKIFQGNTDTLYYSYACM